MDFNIGLRVLLGTRLGILQADNKLPIALQLRSSGTRDVMSG
jgi:hypothetical protein